MSFLVFFYNEKKVDSHGGFIYLFILPLITCITSISCCTMFLNWNLGSQLTRPSSLESDYNGLFFACKHTLLELASFKPSLQPVLEIRDKLVIRYSESCLLMHTEVGLFYFIITISFVSKQMNNALLEESIVCSYRILGFILFYYYYFCYLQTNEQCIIGRVYRMQV